MTGPLESLLARRGAIRGVSVAAATGTPSAAAHGTTTYYADLAAPRGCRHVRARAGTACFVASRGGRHIAQVEQALGVATGECSADGQVSLQAVHCLGYCYTGPAALDGDTVRAGPDLSAQLSGSAPPRAPDIPAAVTDHPQLLSSAAPWSVWPQVLSAGGPQRVLREVRVSGLSGRGGAGFPTAAKWEAVAAAPQGPKYVVANGDEGDPGSFSDRLLMQRYPSKVLEGLALAGLACGARQGFVYVRSEYPDAFDAMRDAAARAGGGSSAPRRVRGRGDARRRVLCGR